MALLPPASSQIYELLPPCSPSAASTSRLLPSLEPQCVARSPSPPESPGLVDRIGGAKYVHYQAASRARRTQTRNRQSPTLCSPNLVFGTPFMGPFGPSAQLYEAREYPTEREPHPSGDSVSETRTFGGFDPATPTSSSFQSGASPVIAYPAPRTLASPSFASKDARESPTGAVMAEEVPFAADEEELRDLRSASDDDEEERRGRRLLRPDAMSNTRDCSRSRTPSKRTSRKPPKRLLSRDGKGPPCVCEETLASSPATIASPGSSPRDADTLPRHSSVLPPSPSDTDPLSTHLQQHPSACTEIDSLPLNPKHRRRQSIASEHLARFVESRTPSSSDPQQSPPSSPPRPVRFQRRYSVSILPEGPERGASATPLDQAPVVGEKDRSHSGSSSSIASSLLSRYFSQDSGPAGSTSSETESTSLPTTDDSDPNNEASGVFCSSPEELHPPPPAAFLTSAWSSLTSLAALSFAASPIVTSQRLPELGEQNSAVAGIRSRCKHTSWPPSPPSSPETDAGSGSARTSSRLSNWSAIRSIHVRFRPCTLSLDRDANNKGDADDAAGAATVVNAFVLRVQDLALQQQRDQQQETAADGTTGSLSLLRYSPTGLSTMPSRWPRVETCVGSPPLIKIEYWSGRKKEIVPEGEDLDQLLRLVLSPSLRT